MAQSAPFEDRTLVPALSPKAGRFPTSVWAKVKLVAGRSFYWSYERGSWQYDIICALILAFIFITPSSWFHDRPTLGLINLRHTHGVIEVGRAPDGWHYLVDARLVTSLEPLKTDDAIRQILAQRLHRSINLKAVSILRDRNDVVLGYTVVLGR
jgi:hypothetical protein